MMLVSTLITSLIASSAVVAAPVVPRASSSAPSDIDILQYALTLEHLENAFYSGALAKFSANDFQNANFQPFVRSRFEEIAAHEETHVQFLSGVLGSQATMACNYSFPYTDPQSFAALSMVLEGVGVTAYLGAAQYIQNKDYLTAAGSILTTEARHAAWVASAVNKGAPWSGAFDTPLDLDQVYSLAAAFITSCPDSNPELPVKAFPALSYTPTSPMPGDSVTLNYNSTANSNSTYNSTNNDNNDYFALFSGLMTTYLPIMNNQIELPKNVTGTVYGVVTSSKNSVNDDNTLAGPAIFIFPDNV